MQPINGVQLHIEIVDFDFGNPDELIDRFSINISDPVGPVSERQSYPGVFGLAELELSLRVVCESQLTGDFCEVPITAGVTTADATQEMTTAGTKSDTTGTITSSTTITDSGQPLLLFFTVVTPIVVVCVSLTVIIISIMVIYCLRAKINSQATRHDSFSASEFYDQYQPNVPPSICNHDYEYPENVLNEREISTSHIHSEVFELEGNPSYIRKEDAYPANVLSERKTGTNHGTQVVNHTDEVFKLEGNPAYTRI